MIRRLFAASIVVLAIMAIGPLRAQKPDPAVVMLEAARQKETLDGDLQGAIKQYQAIVSTYGKTNRAAAAQALVHMAECYQKLGDAEAQRMYERIVREYADQTSAVTIARARLAGNATAAKAGIVTRQVWSNANAVALGSVSPDGRYLSFHDWNTGDLLVHDLANGQDRRLSNSRNSDGYPGGSVFAPDGKQIAFAWADGGRHQLRVIGVNGGEPAIARALLSDNEDIRRVRPAAWSPDGKWIAVQLLRADQTMQIGLVSPIDGSLRVLKSMDWRGSNDMYFSPDGRYLAFDLPSDQDSERRDVFVLAIDGSREIPAVVHPANDLVMGWTPDGRHLLFNSDRNGSLSLWAAPLQRDETPGVPEMVKPDIGLARAMGSTRSGALYLALRTRGPDIYTASIDVDSGKVVSRPVLAVQEFVGANREAHWSRDGRYLSYKSVHQNQMLAVRSVETGRTRYLSPDLTYWAGPRWAPDGRSGIAQGTDRKGRQGIYRIDMQTGAVDTVVVNPPHISYFPSWAPDGKKVFYAFASRGNPHVIVERDLASGQERELLRRKHLDSWSISPDGQNLALHTRDQGANESRLEVLPLAGGETRELLRLTDPEGFRFQPSWTPNSRSLLYQKLPSPGAQESELWVVPVGGGQARKIDLGTAGFEEVRVHPDGRQIAFHTNTSKSEVWVMENFLPALGTKKP